MLDNDIINGTNARRDKFLCINTTFQNLQDFFYFFLKLSLMLTKAAIIWLKIL